MKKWIQVLAVLGLAWFSMEMSSSPVSARMVLEVDGEEVVLNTSKMVKATQTSTDTTSTATTTVVEPVVYEPNYYEVGQCTWGAKELAPWVGTYWGNAGDWADSALAAGFEVGSTPKVGAVMVWSDGGYGHVSVVTEVGADGQIQVMESNYAGNQTIGNYRGWFSPTDDGGSISYIYPKA